MTADVTTETVTEYLRTEQDLFDEPVTAVTSLGGGVSNSVIRVETASECVVVKQPYPDLAVEADWPADVSRVHNEAAAARAYVELIEANGLADVRVPDVVFEDRDAHVIGIECAPEAATAWKRELLDGRVDQSIPPTVGRLLGTVHREAADDAELEDAFGDPRPFEQLRLDPYHRTVAERYPDLADTIEAEIERIRDVSVTLVHGDYSPKNVLVDRETATIWVLDFEVAHWGDPAFDLAFMSNHLLIKSLYNAGRGEEYVKALQAFWDAYRETADRDVERETVAELGILLLARIDGKSPVEYVESERVADAIRSVGRTVLREEVSALAGVLDVAAEERERL